MTRADKQPALEVLRSSLCRGLRLGMALATYPVGKRFLAKLTHARCGLENITLKMTDLVKLNLILSKANDARGIVNMSF